MTTKYLGESTTKKFGGTAKLKGVGGNTRKVGASSHSKFNFNIHPTFLTPRRRKINGRPS
jgi:hypothetical protein